MGWWSLTDTEEMLIGDDVLDETARFLKRLSKIYQKQIKRKITIDELEAVLDASLRFNADNEVIDDFEERKVSGVTIRTAKRPKRQKYKEGDVFAIRLDDRRFAFGRVMALTKKGDLVEIFSYIAEAKNFSQEIVDSGRLFHPIYVSGLEVFRDWQWEVIHSNASYEPHDIGKLKFVIGMPGNFSLSEGGNQHSISDREAEGLEVKSFWRNISVIDRIKKTLPSTVS